MNVAAINPLGDEVRIFRAFAEKSFRNRPKNQVRYFAYLLRAEDVETGLSVGLTPQSAVRDLATNEGYCSISVGEVRGLPYGLDVRLDPGDPQHAYIINLPLAEISDQARELARLIAGELARRSQVETCDTYVPGEVNAPNELAAPAAEANDFNAPEDVPNEPAPG